MRRATAPVLAALALAGCAKPAPDRAAVKVIVHDYILAHPEIVPQAIERLQQDRGAQAIAAERGALERPFAGAWSGSAAPKATLVMFSDYACGYCRASAPAVEKLLATEPRLRVVWREIPVLGPNSEMAARAALAAAAEGRYLGFHRALFAAGRPDAAGVAAAATAAGLDAGALATAARDPAVAREIAANLRLAGRIGVTGTPAFVVGGRLLSGAVGYEALRDAVDQAIRARPAG